MKDRPSYIYGETFSQEAPRPTQMAYEILARHVGFEGEGENKIQTHETLNDIFKAIGKIETDVSMALEKLEQAKRLRREDTLVLVVLFAVSKSLGPDLNFLRQALLNGNITDNIIRAVSNLDLDRNIIDYLTTTLETLKN